MTEHERFENYAAWHEAWKQQQKRIDAVEQQRDHLLDELHRVIAGDRSFEHAKRLIAEIEATK